MIQGSVDRRSYRARRLVEALAAKEAVDAFMEENRSQWNDATYEHYRCVLSNFADTFSILPTVLHEVVEYVENHTLKKSNHLWALGTVRSCYKAIRTFYTWTRVSVPGAELLMILPPPSDRRIQNFGKKKYRRN